MSVAPALLAIALSAPATPESIARQFLDQMAARHFAAAGAAFTDPMKDGLPPAKLERLWDGLQGQKGAFQKIERMTGEQVADGIAVLATCRFAKAPVTFEVYVDGQHRIAGFFLTPASIVARRFVNLLAKSDFAGAEEMFDAKMRDALPAPKLTALWQGLIAEAGAFQGLERSKVQPAGDDWVAIATAGFAKKSVILRVAVDGEARVIGFFRE